MKKAALAKQSIHLLLQTTGLQSSKFTHRLKTVLRTAKTSVMTGITTK